MITPELVDQIEISGDQIDTNWLESPFCDIIDLLLEKYKLDEIEEMIFDEDPNIIDIGTLTLTNPIQEFENTEIEKVIRLYFPVLLVIIRKMRLIDKYN